MFISRKTVKLPTLKNKVSNQQVEGQSAIDQLRSTTNHRHRPQTEVTRYPVFNMLLAIAFLVAFIYLMYSVNGGSNSIPGFNERLWWQYLLSLIALLVSVLLLILSQIETVEIARDTITFSKSILLGFYKWEIKQRDLGELLGISIIKKGIQRITFTNSSYFLVFNFRPYQQIQALQCSSDITATEYLEQLKSHVPHLRRSQHRISVKNIVEK